MAPKKELIDLDTCVIDALEMFSEMKLPKLVLGKFKRPLVVGSGNAAATGKILFADKDAVFADESNFKKKIKSAKVDGVVLISASGAKHAPTIAKALRRRRVPIVLMTNNPEAPASKYADTTHIFPKQPEPYTYNVSTYLGMILAKTKENPKKILSHIRRIRLPDKLRNYDAFYIILQEKHELLKEMIATKFDELFGPKISGRVYTYEQTKHAKTIVQSEKELFIGLGVTNRTFGKRRLHVPLPKNAGPAEALMTAYYIVGKIQKQNPPYFKRNIQAYAKRTSKIFGQTIKPIVD